MNLRFILSLLLGSIIFSSWGLSLSKEERKMFRKVDEIGCVIDFSDITIDGIGLSTFIPYYAESIGKSEQYVTTLFESLPQIIRSYPKDLLNRDLRNKIDAYSTLGNRKYLSNIKQKYNIKIIVTSLSPKGAIDATVRFYKDNPDDYYEFEMIEEEGKWNNDLVLIKEKMASLGAKTAYKIYCWGRDSFPKELKDK